MPGAGAGGTSRPLSPAAGGTGSAQPSGAGEEALLAGDAAGDTTQAPVPTGAAANVRLFMSSTGDAAAPAHSSLVW